MIPLLDTCRITISHECATVTIRLLQYKMVAERRLSVVDMRKNADVPDAVGGFLQVVNDGRGGRHSETGHSPGERLRGAADSPPRSPQSVQRSALEPARRLTLVTVTYHAYRQPRLGSILYSKCALRSEWPFMARWLG